VDDASFFVHDNSSAALFSEVLEPVLSVHVPLGEIAVLVLEPSVVARQQLAEHLGLHLFYELGKGVPVNEAPFLGVMPVKVAVEAETVLFHQMPGESLDPVDCGVLLSVWMDVEAVEVVAVDVHTEVAVVDSVDVDHGDHHEDEHVSE
jgi:hypothetical protein